MRTQLYDHNKTAYEKVMRAFETSDRTCVVHPTGTGKSYLIAAVSEQYNKVLILGPNIFVLDQVHEVLNWRNDVEYRSYAWLMNNVTDITEQYDLICLDEFHRTGASEWGAAVELLIESQPKAKVLGTTATHIRHLDDGRNMADELFGGNIASMMTIAEAWSGNVLPIPTYVSGFFRFDKIVDDAHERISQFRRIGNEQRRQRIFRLSNMKLDWELSYGMSSILRKHLDPNARRAIVFCSHIDKLRAMQKQVKGWFREAGFSVAGTYAIHGDMSERSQRAQMKDFAANDGDGVRLMFAVNMLNEGIHVPDVNAVIMLRTTSSHIIYMQQLGRCLTVANSERPLVMDMVDNITTTTSIKGYAEEFNRLELLAAQQEGREPRRFEVTDYTLGVRELIERLVPTLRDYRERMTEVVDFFDQNGRPPTVASDTSEQERKVAILWRYVKKKHPDDPLVQEYVEREREYRDGYWTRMIDQVEAFAREHGRTPTHCRKEDAPLGYQWKSIKQNRPNDPRVRQLIEQYGYLSQCYQKMVNTASEVMAHCQQYGHQPRTTENQKLFARWFVVKKTYPDAPEVKAVTDHYPEYDYTLVAAEKNVQRVGEYYEQNGYFPPRDSQLGQRWATLRKKYAHLPEVQRLAAIYNQIEYRPKDVDDRVNDMLRFHSEHGRLPGRTTDERMYRRLMNLIKTYPEHPGVKRLVEIRERTKKNKQQNNNETP